MDDLGYTHLNSAQGKGALLVKQAILSVITLRMIIQRLICCLVFTEKLGE